MDKKQIQIREALAFQLFRQDRDTNEQGISLLDHEEAWREEAGKRSIYRSTASTLAGCLEEVGLRIANSSSKKLEKSLEDLATAPAKKVYVLDEEASPDLEQETTDTSPRDRLT